jgi:hypothetical protein
VPLLGGGTIVVWIGGVRANPTLRTTTGWRGISRGRLGTTLLVLAPSKPSTWERLSVGLALLGAGLAGRL